MMRETKRTPAFDADEIDALRDIGWQPAADGSVCPDSSLLLAAEDGVLDDVIADRVRSHVQTCATCQQLSRDLAAVFAEDPAGDAVARIRARVTAAPSPRPGRLYLWLGGLAAAAAMAWFLFVPRGSTPPAPETQLARATPVAIPTVFVVDRPIIPPGDVDLTVRGDVSKRVSLEDQIAAALDRADKGDLAGAILELEQVAKRNGTSRIAALALGAVQLRAGRNAEAVETFDRAQGLTPNPAVTDEFDWFYSIALVRTVNKDRARTLLDGVCRRGGARSASACAGLAELNR